MVFRRLEIKKQELPVLAVDLGGTKIITAIISNKGQIIAREYSLTLADEGPQSVINRILSAIDHLLSQSNIESSKLDSISIALISGFLFPMICNLLFLHHQLHNIHRKKLA